MSGWRLVRIARNDGRAARSSFPCDRRPAIERACADFWGSFNTKVNGFIQMLSHGSSRTPYLKRRISATRNKGIDRSGPNVISPVSKTLLGKSWPISTGTRGSQSCETTFRARMPQDGCGLNSRWARSPTGAKCPRSGRSSSPAAPPQLAAIQCSVTGSTARRPQMPWRDHGDFQPVGSSACGATSALHRDPRDVVGRLIGLIHKPYRYEVRRVGPAGSLGQLFVEGERIQHAADVRKSQQDERVSSKAPVPSARPMSRSIP